MKEISIIVAVAARGAIGRQGGLLCHLPADLRRFKSLTTGHSVVMGRRTFESLPHGPLPGRQNIVVTHNRHYHPQGVTVAHDVQQAIELATMPGEVFIIGGAQIYQAALPLAHTLHLTEIHAHFADADTFFLYKLDGESTLADWLLDAASGNLYSLGTELLDAE